MTAVTTPVEGGAAAIADGARDLVAETIHWSVTETSTALIELAVAAALFFALAALRRVVAPAQPWTALAPASFSGMVRRVFGHTKDWFILLLSARMTLVWFATPELLARGIEQAFIIALVWQGALWVRGFALGFFARRAASGPDDGQLATAMGILQVLVSAFAFIIAFILMIDNLGANVTALIAGLGVGGIAIGLAAQGVLGDLFAALSIIFDRTFGKGDSVAFEGVEGTVEEIGLKTTRIRAVSGEEVIVANAKLLDMTIRNYNRLGHRRVTLNLGIPFSTPAALVRALPDELGAVVTSVPDCVFVRGALTGFGDSRLDVALTFDVQSPAFDVMVARRHAVIVVLIERLEALGIPIAYPGQVQIDPATYSRARSA